MRNRIFAMAAVLVLAAAGDSAAQIQKYAMQWKGPAASASGFVTLDLSLVPNPGESASYIDGGITDIEISVVGAFSGNGTFTLADYDGDPVGGFLALDTGVDALDFTRELVGQPTGDSTWGTLGEDAGYFHLFRDVGSLAPATADSFAVLTGTGTDELALTSFRPALCGAAPAPSVDCPSPDSARLVIKDTSSRDSLKWSWNGYGFDESDLGDPTADTYYSLCIYDETAAVPALAAELGINHGEGWTDDGSRGIEYESTGESFGVTRARVRLGAEGKASVKLQAGTESLKLPSPVGTEFFDQDSKVTVQLVSSEGTCWQSTFAAGSTSRNAPGSFKARTP